MVDKIFKNSDQETEAPPATRKRKYEQQWGFFDKLPQAATLRIQQLDDDIIVELEVRYQDFKDKMSGVDLSPASQSSSANVPTTLWPPVFKPIKSFFENGNKSTLIEVKWDAPTFN